MGRKARPKEQKLTGAVFRNALLSIDKEGNVIAEIDSKHMGRAILSEFKGVRGLAHCLRCLLEADDISPMVRFNILKLAVSVVERMGETHERVELAKLSLDELKNQRQELIDGILHRFGESHVSSTQIRMLKDTLGIDLPEPPPPPPPPKPAEEDPIDVEVRELLAPLEEENATQPQG